MQATIKPFNPKAEFFTDERCFIIESSNCADDPDLSIARARVEPGVTTRWHRVRNTIERYVILEGLGLVEVGDLAPQPVSPGDVILIPPSCAQRIGNIGDTDLIFLAICSPRFTNDAYESIEANS